MRFNFNQKEIEVTIKDAGDNRLAFIDDAEIPFQAEWLNDNLLTIEIDNQRHIVYLANGNGATWVSSGGKSYLLEKIDAEAEKHFGDEGANLDKLILKPPMPGSIVKVEVETGQKVNEGDALIIIEAMKMETTLFSSITGVVTEVNVSAKEQVSADKVLIVVEKEIV